MPELKDKELVIVEVPRYVRQKIRVVASLEAMTTPQYLEWLINKAYETKIHNHQASAKVKKNIEESKSA
jgi:tRNA(Phe) wybutosine-synthesizing methylase Tyw3